MQKKTVKLLVDFGPMKAGETHELDAAAADAMVAAKQAEIVEKADNPSETLQTLIADRANAAAAEAVKAMLKTAGGKGPRIDIVTDEAENYAKSGRFFPDVVMAARKGVYAPGLREWNKKAAALDPETKGLDDAQSTRLDAFGGFLVPPEIAGDIWRKASTTGEILSRVRTIMTSSNRYVQNMLKEDSRAAGYRYGGLAFKWLGEHGTKTATRAEIEQREFPLHKLAGFVALSDECMEDAPAMTSLINELAPEAMRCQLEEAIVRGTGANQPLGILRSPAYIEVDEESGQASNTWFAENGLNQWARLHAASLGAAVWLINQTVYPSIFKSYFSVGAQNVPMFFPGGGLPQAPAGTLMGKPIVPVEHTSVIGVSGDVIFADLSQYWLVAKAGGPKQDISMHVRFLEDEQVLRFVWRVGGAPIWPGKLELPNSGSPAVTVSPFVGVETR